MKRHHLWLYNYQTIILTLVTTKCKPCKAVRDSNGKENSKGGKYITIYFFA